MRRATTPAPASSRRTQAPLPPPLPERPHSQRYVRPSLPGRSRRVLFLLALLFPPSLGSFAAILPQYLRPMPVDTQAWYRAGSLQNPKLDRNYSFEAIIVQGCIRVLVLTCKHSEYSSWCSALCSHRTVPSGESWRELRVIGQPHLCTLAHVYAAPLFIAGGVIVTIGLTAVV
jgi:hypothetical protein